MKDKSVRVLADKKWSVQEFQPLFRRLAYGERGTEGWDYWQVWNKSENVGDQSIIWHEVENVGDQGIATEEVEKALKKLKAWKAAGLDGEGTEYLRSGGDEHFEWLSIMYNVCLEVRRVPVDRRVTYRTSERTQMPGAIITRGHCIDKGAFHRWGGGGSDITPPFLARTLATPYVVFYKEKSFGIFCRSRTWEVFLKTSHFTYIS